MENMSIKSKLWNYEEEIRIVKKQKGLQKINKAAIKKIYFGINSASKDINEIKKVCKDNGYKKIKY